MFHFVSHDFANFYWTWRFVLFVCWYAVWVSFVFVCVFGLLCFSSENSAFNSRFILSNFQLLTDNVSYSIGNAGKKPRHTHCLLSNASAQILKLSTRSIVSAVSARGRVHLWLLSRTLSLMQDLLWYFDPHIPLYLIGRPGHSALRVHQGQFQMWSLGRRHPNLRWPFGAE